MPAVGNEPTNGQWTEAHGITNDHKWTEGVGATAGNPAYVATPSYIGRFPW